MKSYNMKSFLLIVLLGISSISAAQNLLDLSGNWELALDSTDVGEKEAVRTYEQRTTIRYQVSEISAFYPDCW